MSESSSVRRALSLVREEISPTLDDKARLRARIVAPAALIASGESAPQGATPQGAAPRGGKPAAALTRWAALKAAGTLGAALGLALLGGGGGIGFWLGHDVGVRAGAELAVSPAPNTLPGAAIPDGASPASSASSAASSAATQSTSGSNDSASASDPSASTPSSLAEPPRSDAPRGAAELPRAEAPPRADVPTRAHARRRAQPNPLNDELALLRRVERALRNNDPALARALLGELDERFPDSRLGEERSAARRIADCRSDELGAREEARAFLRQHGASVYRQRIVLACGLDAEPREKSAPAGSGAAPMTNAERADTHVR